VSLVLNLKECSVVVTQLGDNPSALEGGLLLSQGESRKLQHGDAFEFLEGLFKHRICFEPPPKAPREASEAPLEAPKPKLAKLFEKNGSSTGTWETVDQGRMLVYTPHNVIHSTKANT